MLTYVPAQFVGVCVVQLHSLGHKSIKVRGNDLLVACRPVPANLSPSLQSDSAKHDQNECWERGRSDRNLGRRSVAVGDSYQVINEQEQYMGWTSGCAGSARKRKQCTQSEHPGMCRVTGAFQEQSRRANTPLLHKVC